MFTDEQVEAAVRALSEPERFAGAERRVSAIAPQLQQILAQALNEGGWFGEAHESQLRQALGEADPAEQAARIRTLLAEETRMGMLIGVAVGWELARELENSVGAQPAEPAASAKGTVGAQPAEPAASAKTNDERGD